jgi:cytosine/adenosine deaminase-related metal-dependent hydrolase
MMNIDNSFHTPSKKSSLQTYFHKLSKAESIILVHNTFTTKNDIEFATNNKADNQLLSFCVCINANQYIENTIPPIKLLIQNDCNITLGTDSLASNHSLNLLDEMKTIQKNFHDISLEKMLQWSTINGAKALQMDKTFGSFENGKMPGVVLIENCLTHDLLDFKISKIKKII